MREQTYVFIDVDEIKVEREWSFLLIIDGEEFWLGKSQIKDAESYSAGMEELEMEVAEWIAKKEGWI